MQDRGTSGFYLNKEPLKQAVPLHQKRERKNQSKPSFSEIVQQNVSKIPLGYLEIIHCLQEKDLKLKGKQQEYPIIMLSRWPPEDPFKNSITDLPKA